MAFRDDMSPILCAAEPDAGEVEVWVDSLRSAYSQGPGCYLPEGWHAAVGRLLAAIDESALTPALLDRVRREEGERIAQAIEARSLPTPERGTPGPVERAVYADAAWIARAASVGRGEGL
ncbi:hypothetical protein [Nocardioides lacusdianchii]|uniref:hypothetical protein n=1 Tax=Nocardioides lacusdianchii TaxID=2783664 RepID=UPI001CCCF3DE|nr:hypothetical protein [Nocardioides lacusdianchii]